ncbi:MAG: 30S ribosomal protein S16 [Synergistaceae bacterium]|nr:30S ribosomal protein S16 [Synergistaceae bacterium]MBQ4419079.1 30S ribosomal protein S16 [Synergistaceae bacterium]MBQ7570320.1 30S ribosomal protein S16 [Synergistaceae bacterium]MBQ9580878.1 30S ribosomal protein S16 [Synergistaceae bacterium]MBR0097733.1 30S ribosomal protein S16 [Synergistaceae bacterium]
MAVRIRLSRQGKKKAPFYRLVVADSRAPRDGKFIELIGTYNPMTDPAAVTIDEDRALYWLGQGASPSDTARGLLKKQGIWEKFEAKKA